MDRSITLAHGRSVLNITFSMYLVGISLGTLTVSDDHARQTFNNGIRPNASLPPPYHSYPLVSGKMIAVDSCGPDL